MDFVDAVRTAAPQTVVFAVGIGMILWATFRTPVDREPAVQQFGQDPELAQLPDPPAERD